MTLTDPNDRHHSQNPAEGPDHGTTAEPMRPNPQWPGEPPQQRDDLYLPGEGDLDERGDLAPGPDDLPDDEDDMTEDELTDG